MGYTHYWYRPPEMDPEIFSAWSSDVRKIVMAARQGGLVIVDGVGENPDPSITAEEVYLNGEPAYETFNIDRVDNGGRAAKDEAFGFCKTGRQPYDIVVVAALIALKARFGEAVKVSSDGDRQEWEAGIALADKVLGTGDSWDFDKDDDGSHLVNTEV